MSVQFAMPRVASSIAASAVSPVARTGVDEGERVRIRDAVVAGPGSAGGLGEGSRASILETIVGAGVVERALAEAGHVDVRRQVLVGGVTALSVLGLCLYGGEGYESVLGRIVPAVAGPRPPGAGVPTGSAFSQARARLADEPMRVLFEITAAAGTQPGAGPVPGSTAFGLEVTAVDGTVWDLPATDPIRAEYATPPSGRYPQARMVTVNSCGTRKVRAAALGSSAVGEQTLLDTLAGAFGPGTLNLADRGFFSMNRWVRFSATGAHLLWRVKNGAKSLPLKIIEGLSDGSALVRLRESDSMLCRRRKDAGDKTLPRLPATIARLIEFDLVVTDEHGKRRTSRLRLLTTLLDPATHPALALARAYAERWQIELAYFRIKVTLRGSRKVLRGQTPALARQEIWGFLTLYNALCDLAVAAAALDGIDPDEISFIAAVRLTRTRVSAGVCHAHCGRRPSDHHDPISDLIDAIAAHPRNRTGRNRSSPRTAKQRRTQPSTTVTYSIEITTSNLPKETRRS